MIEFGDLQADLPTYQNSGAIKVDNVIPLTKGYRSFPSFVHLSNTGLTSTPVGLFSSFTSGGVTNYAGDTTKLYQMDSSLVFQDKSKSGGYSNNTNTGTRDFWAFTQFGTNIIATNGYDNIQKFDESAGGLFADLTDFAAKYISVIRDFVVTGYVTDYETAKTFTANNISSNAIPITSHGYSTGDTVTYDNNGNANLTNLVNGTRYYINKVDNNNVRLATNVNNAVAGTIITLTAPSGSAQTHKLAKYIAYNQRVKWSGINDSSTWTPSGTTQSGFQDIVGAHGGIQAISGGESFGIIFLERAIYRMSYVGSPLIFQFDKIADSIGAFAPKSVASFGSDVYFLAQDGFYKISGGQQLVPIGRGKIDDFFLNDVTSNFEGITSAIDPNNSMVVWSYRGSGATGGGTVNNKLICYNFNVDKWSTGSGQDLQFINSASQEAFTTLESLNALGTLDGLPKSLDSFFYDEGVIGLAGFDSNNRFGKFLGNSLSATVDTTEFEGAENSRSTLIEARPIVDANGSDNTTITVTPISRSSQADAVTTGTAVNSLSNGSCPLRTTSRYHRLRIGVTGNFTTMSGVDVDSRKEGKR
jgi:hypothetical protein|tara:strand:- start:3864 stop:5621 length:1758 start_codon:yes stop_codon:yes gene_type:complete